MSGRGGVINGTWDRFVPPECQPNPSILRLDARLEWEEAKEPLHYDIDVTKVCGIGPGMAFADSILERDSSIVTIGLVPCAVGGTNIAEWGRGSGLYNQMVRRAEAAAGDGGKISGFLWYQGESDTLSKEDAMLYRPRLEKFFTDVRSDLQSPTLPIIQVAIASGKGQYVDIVRKAQLENELPGVTSVDAKGLKLEPDGLHLSAAAQVELGEMLADAFLRMMVQVTPHIMIWLYDTIQLLIPDSNMQRILLLVMLLILVGGYLQFTNFFGGKLYLQIAMNIQFVREKLYPKNIVYYEKNIFILAGQSNMVGRGGVSEKGWDRYIPVECQPNRNILRLNERNELEVAKDPLHQGLDNKVCGVGPGMAFANRILKADPNFGSIILVPCALGGSKITEWSSFNSTLRQRLVWRTNEAIRFGGKLRAILWYQGESETRHIHDATHTFPLEFKRFLSLLYKDLNDPDDVPFIQVALALGKGDKELIEKVRAAQLAMEDVITVDAMGLPLGLAGLHLTTPAQVRLGNMMADAFLETRFRSKSFRIQNYYNLTKR
ncbi:putative carbohydrate esterase [Dorcoceras hygrometricum]|uniref:Putative carbohydrate esterase n=1 Tax=Dorcoceras hygrometricum TaxID=472368 RepID=A0A2Z7D4L3_9LAMI|nr:putative carbohydrate esterase [Dorcoceras hygrometricum]